MIIATKDAYAVYKYDNDFVDLLVYNDVNYKHFVVYNDTIEVLSNEDCEIIASLANTTSNYNKAVDMIS